jgi:hypothetical protein
MRIGFLLIIGLASVCALMGVELPWAEYTKAMEHGNPNPEVQQVADDLQNGERGVDDIGIEVVIESAKYLIDSGHVLQSEVMLRTALMDLLDRHDKEWLRRQASYRMIMVSLMRIAYQTGQMEEAVLAAHGIGDPELTTIIVLSAISRGFDPGTVGMNHTDAFRSLRRKMTEHVSYLIAYLRMARGLGEPIEEIDLIEKNGDYAALIGGDRLTVPKGDAVTIYYLMGNYKKCVRVANEYVSEPETPPLSALFNAFTVAEALEAMDERKASKRMRKIAKGAAIAMHENINIENMYNDQAYLVQP